MVVMIIFLFARTKGRCLSAAPGLFLDGNYTDLYSFCKAPLKFLRGLWGKGRGDAVYRLFRIGGFERIVLVELIDVIVHMQRLARQELFDRS